MDNPYLIRCDAVFRIQDALIITRIISIATISITCTSVSLYVYKFKLQYIPAAASEWHYVNVRIIAVYYILITHTTSNRYVDITTMPGHMHWISHIIICQNINVFYHFVWAIIHVLMYYLRFTFTVHLTCTTSFLCWCMLCYVVLCYVDESRSMRDT